LLKLIIIAFFSLHRSISCLMKVSDEIGFY
jgi:hypothetical protein